MTESEVRKLLRRMKELDSQTAFRAFYDMTYDRLYRIAYYLCKTRRMVAGNRTRCVPETLGTAQLASRSQKH